MPTPLRATIVRLVKRAARGQPSLGLHAPSTARGSLSDCHNNTTPSGPLAARDYHPLSTMSKVAPEGDILDEAERLTATPRSTTTTRSSCPRSRPRT